MANWLEQADARVAAILADWSPLTTLLAIIIVAFVLYPIIFYEEPDTHPLLLARQSNASAIRNRGESGLYRSPEVPVGYPLKTGLNVKDVGAPRWAGGKDGDLRDIWREVQKAGSTGPDNKPIPKGLIMTVLGKEEVVEHDVQDLTKEVAIMGKHFQKTGVKKVAIYLPNSVEYLLTVFACSFYGLSPILLPYNQPHAKVYELVKSTGADGLVCAAGNLPLDDVAKTCKNLRLLTWVVEKTSRHMDWNGVPDGAQGRLSVSVWHDVVDENKATPTNTSLPGADSASPPGDIITVWQAPEPGASSEIVAFTQANFVAAIAALISAIPLRQRLTPEDLVLPADSFTYSFVLCETLAALYTHASLAITSVAVPGVDFALAKRGVAPTVVIASAETLVKLHQQESAGLSSALKRLGKYTHTQTMSAGRMPSDSLVFKLLAPSPSAKDPGKLRLILTSDRVGAGSPPLTSAMLSDLRIFTRSRIVYALTAAKVAGAVAQTNVFDYRRDEGSAHSHFGIPLSSVEVKFRNSNDAEVSGSTPKGQIIVSGPAVVGGEVALPEVQGRMRKDSTIAYA